MSLHEYRRKRDFNTTREPAPGGELLVHRAIFVVQLHHASRRHYDFRLQVGDALKSWAVPKGPSFDPKVRRMAVEVEDHPLDYAEFEGDIPEGQYGAGHVEIFDRGIWSTGEDATAQLEAGHLRFELFGERLHGQWNLIRTQGKGKQPSWLLVKGQDPYAGDFEADDLLTEAPPEPGHAALPAEFNRRVAALDGAKKAKFEDGAFEPQLARLAEKPPAGDDWLHEVKWDGYRILASIARGKPRLWSRNGIEWTDRVPDIVEALAGLGLDTARLDGELIAVHGGISDFGALQATLAGQQHAPLVYVLFDASYLQGFDLSRTPLTERKAVLERLLEVQPSRHLQYSTHVRGGGDAAFEAASAQNLEGIISKRARAGYRAGRGDDWLKIKRLDSDEFAIVGFTAPKGSRNGFGSLLLARPDGRDWRYVGRVGSGFSDQLLREVAGELIAQGQSKPTVRIAGIDPLLRGASWVPPERVVEVYYRGMGRLGLLRQPSLKGLRPDKRARDLHDSDRAGSTASGGSKRAREESTVVEPVTISNPDRVVFPDRGITKQEVADYYRTVMDWLLPEVIGRPLSVIRCPAGIAEQCFFQKHMLPGPKRVSTVKLKEESGAAGDYLYVDHAEALIELVQFGGIEFHPWGSTVDAPDAANRIVFDLDPGPGVDWKRVVAAARRVREILEQLGLVSYLRATGGKGLHVVMPLRPAADWSIVKPFARAVAESMAQAAPQEFVSTATKKLRDGRIFVDYLRNGRGATAIASYSLRSRPGAPVAVPLRWDELGRLGRGDKFTLENVPRRLARLDADPWEGIDGVEQDITRLAERLNGEA